MAIDIPLELDSGPITWVKAEIDSALFRALTAIEALRTSPTSELRGAIRTDLHQVSGAFELVGIEGLAVLVQEFEKHFASDVETVPSEALDLIDRGCRRLLAHLKEMASGSPPVPLKFISEYLSLGKLRRSKFGPADLFFPDLSRRPAKIINADPPEPSRMPAFLLRQRRDFQQGLLLWLRGNETGLDQMRAAISAIEAAYPLPSQRSFWWATHALLEATHSGLLEPSTALKQLMARVDLQVRRFVEGSTRVADRLRREVLYHIARAQVGNPRVDAVKALYDLGVLVPKRIPREIDVVTLQPAIDSLGTIVRRCKDAWTSLSSGRRNALARLREGVAELPAACDALQMPDFSSLGHSIAEAAASVTDSKSIGDDLSIEFATSLILLETALEHIAALPASFRNQVDRAVQRLAYAASNAPIPAELRAEIEANSLTRLAQEKQTISQVAREIRSNMRLVEQALDAVFRDRLAVDELKAVPALLGQVSGAMRMLGWDGANELLTDTSDRLINLVRRDETISTPEIDSLADVLAGLSFYVDVRERREQDAEAILIGLARRLRGEVASESTDSDNSVEASIAERQRKLRPLALAVSNEPERSELRDTLRTTLQGVRQDAELLSDSGLSEASTEALRLLDNADTSSTALSAAVANVVGGNVGVPPTSSETSRLVESRQDEQDTALLEIFVEEAVEVIAAMRAQHAELLVHHDRREPLIDLRRAFHTLKGSGRMVGQVSLAELAWRVEGVLNRALESERPVNEPEIKLIAVAIDNFDIWVEALRKQQPMALDVAALDELIEQCAPRSQGAAMPPHDGVTTPVVTQDFMELLEAPRAVDETPSSASVEAMELDALLERAMQSLALDAPPEPAAGFPLAVAGSVSAATANVTPMRAGGEFQSLAETGDEIPVLGVSVSRALFSILTDETRVHLQTLDYELTLMQFDPELLPSDAMVRASHTLCGIHRTAGFPEIGDFAGRLENALMAVRRSGRTDSAIGVFAAAIQALRTATLRLQARSPMTSEEHSHIEQSRMQLLALISRAGSTDLDAELDLFEQTRAEPAAPHASAAATAESLMHERQSSVPVGSHAALSRSPKQSETEAVDVEAPAVPEKTSGVSVIADLDFAGSSPIQVPATSAVAEATSIAAVVTPPTSAAADLDIAPVSASPQPFPVASVPDTQPVRPLSAVDALVQLTATAPVVAAAGLTASTTATQLTSPSVFVARPALVNVTPTPAPDTRDRLKNRSVEDPLADVRDDLDEQVLPIFLEEAQELFPKAGAQVNAWRGDVSNPIHSDGLKRTLHTLKGSARMAGAMRLGEVAHNLESRLLDVNDVPAPTVFDSFDEYLDDIAFLLERLTRGEKDAVLPRYVTSRAQPEVLDEAFPVDATTGDTVDATQIAVSAGAAGTVASPARSLTEIARGLVIRPTATTTAAPLVGEPAGTAFLRVRSDAVEQLADEAGEISIHRSRIEAEMRSLKTGLLDLTASVVRLRGQLREIEIQGESQIQSRLDQESEFDPLEFDRYTRFQELTRGLAEGVNDVATVQQGLLKNLADADIALLTQTRLSRSVQLRLQTLRTVPFSNVSDRLYRVLRQTAKELGKRANLDIQGGRIEIDRSVLERLAPVLEHLVRNALAHGIEAESMRLALGKPGIGEITLSARQQGNEVAISLVDDGGGIPLDKVHSRAVALGLISTEDATTEGQLVELIFQPGFSTAEQVTAVAGRGVGMDVVRSEVAALGGRVEVHTSKGVRTSFTLSVPLTLAVTQVLLVGVGKSVFGVPSSLIAQVRQVPVKERAVAIASGRLVHDGRELSFRSLGDLMRISHDVVAQRTAPILVLRAGDAMAAVQVDRVINNQEVVAKPYGPQLARVPGLAGLTVLANGTIALLINPLNLLLSQSNEPLPQHHDVTVKLAEPVSEAPAPVAHTLVPALQHREDDDTHDDKAVVATPIVDVASVPALLDLPAPSSISPVVLEPVASAEPLDIVATPAMHSATVTPIRRETVEARIPIVLVVDDSLTVRKITSRLLEREGYKALTAKDGLDALQILSDVDPDVILLDIEMPRMDGFEFTRTIKADNRQSHIPIIMITSRTAEKHRNHAMELGVNEYVGKPYQDERLMALVVKYAGKPT